MTAQEAITALDNALAQSGETIMLRRVVGTAPNAINVDCPDIPAKVTYPSSQEIAAGVKESSVYVIISPTVIAAAKWPGGERASLTVAYPVLPRRNDKLLIDGRIYNVERQNPFRIGGTVVRIEIEALG